MSSIGHAFPQAGLRVAHGLSGEKKAGPEKLQQGIFVEMVTSPLCPKPVDVQSLMQRARSGSMSADEKREAFNRLAKELDGKQLGEFAARLPNREDVIALGKAVAQHADSHTKVAFRETLAPRTLEKDVSRVISPAFGTGLETGDMEARAIAEVIGSMDKDPVALTRAVGALSDEELMVVGRAGLNERAMFGGSTVSVSHDPKALFAMLDAAAASKDPAVKARLFRAGADALKTVRDNTKPPVISVGPDDVAKRIADKMAKLLDTDARGIVRELTSQDRRGKGLSAYTTELLRAGEGGQKTLGRQLAQLQGAGTAYSPIEFMEQKEPGSSKSTWYQNAQSLGYFAGAIRKGLDAQVADSDARKDMIKVVFGAVVGAFPLGSAGAAAGGLTGPIVDAVMRDANKGLDELAEAFDKLAMPADGKGAPYRGPAKSDFGDAYRDVSLSK